MTDELKTGVEQAIETPPKAGRGGVVPPRDKRFGQPNGNPINKKGIPSTAIEVRHLIQAIGAQRLPLPQSEREKAEKKRRKYITRLEALLTSMFSSRAPADKAAILKGGYPGLLKDEVENTGNVTLKVVYEDKRGIPDNAPEAAPKAG